jgi:hypothetical protein
MKRYLLLIAACVLSATAVVAQDSDDKRYVPESGDFSIGIDVKPLFNYVGNMFNGTTENEIENIGGQPITGDNEDFAIDDIAPDVSIMGKYMLTNNWALRANIGVMLSNKKERAYVRDDAAFLTNPFSEDMLIDTRTASRNGLSAMLGAEYHKGTRRVQGIFGFGLLVGFNQAKTSYNYANALTVINQHPSAYWNTFTGSYRTLTSKTESNVFFGISGSAGVEWFVAPKVALGAEVNLSLYSVLGGQVYVEEEGYNSVLGKVETRYEIMSPGDRALVFGTQNLGGSLYMSFYF